MSLLNIKTLMKKFNQVSGLDVALIDRNFNSIISIKNPANHFCNAIHYFDKCKNICKTSDIEHCLIANSSRNLVKFTCPFGFYMALAPITSKDGVVAYLAFAPALEKKEGAEQNPIDLASSIIPEINKTHLKWIIKNVPCYDKETLDIYADFLMLIADSISQNQPNNFPKQNISTLAKDYIDQNISQKFTLASLSSMLHCSTVTLTEHFRRDYNITINQYITNKRMERAEEFLLETEDSIADIAVCCGYTDVEYFSRAFKRYHSISPSNYRKQKKKNS